jgi:hypothetical protein
MNAMLDTADASGDLPQEGAQSPSFDAVRGGQANGGGSWDRVTLATFALRLLGESSPAATASVNPSLSCCEDKRWCGLRDTMWGTMRCSLCSHDDEC